MLKNKKQVYGYVYKTTNMVNGKVYIGKKKGSFDPNYYGSGFILKRAIEKEGPHNFKIEILGYCISKEQQNELEKKLIYECRQILNKENVYNIADGGDGGDTFSCNPNKEKIRKKISKIVSGKNHPMYGRHHTIESINKIRANRAGGVVHHSLETKARLRQSKLGNKNPAKRTDVKVKMRLNHADVSGANNPMFGKGYLTSGKNNGMYGRRGRNNPNFGSHRSEETRKKQSKSLKKYWLSKTK